MRRFWIGSFAFSLVVGLVALPAAGTGCLAGPEEDERDEDRKVLIIGPGGERTEWLSAIRENEGSGAFLGVGVEEETERPEGGARINHVVEGSPADEAGLRKNDIIVRFDGKQVHGPLGLTKRIRASEPGAEVEIDVVRKEKPLTLTAELGERKNEFRFLPGGDGEHALTYRFLHDGLEDRLERLKDIVI